MNWFSRHYRWLLLVLAGYAVVLYGLWNYQALASQATNATTAYFVVANLIVLWWYADTTHQQWLLDSKSYIEQNKPIVYSDRWEHPEKPDNYYYVFRNVGGGYAANVYYLRDEEKPVALGSIAAGDERRFPADVNDRLCERHTNEGLGDRHLLVAEAPYTRTTQWTVTLNFRTPASDRRRGHVEHGHARPRVAPPRGENQPLDDFLELNERTFFEQLSRLK